MTKRHRLERLLRMEKQRVNTIDSLLIELRQVSDVETRPTDLARLALDIQRQEANAAAALTRLDDIERQLRALPPEAKAPLQFYPPPAGAPKPATRTLNVVLSYAHEETQHWVSQLLTHLGPARDEGLISVWHDRHILAGTDWHEEIALQISKADAAIVVISASYLASSYVRKFELPLLLQRHHQGDLSLIPILVEHCDFRNARYWYPDSIRGPQSRCLGSLQLMHDAGLPLSTMASPEATSVLANMAVHVRQLAASLQTRASE